MRLAGKLALVLFSLLSVLLAGYTLLTLDRQHQLFESDIREDTRLLGAALLPAVQAALEQGGLARTVALLDSLDTVKPRLSIEWAWPDRPGPRDAPGPAADELAALRQGRTVSRHETDPQGQVYLRSYVPVGTPAAGTGCIRVSESLALRDAFLRRSLLELLGLAVSIALAGALAASWLGRTIIGRPVQLLVEKARQVGRGDLDTPIVLPYSDELGLLADELNAMGANLHRLQTELSRQEKERADTQLRLQHADRLSTVGTLAAGVAHEVGTPLNVISGHAELIEQGVLAGEAAAASAKAIREQAQRITGIVRQLLDFARRGEPDRKTTDLGRCLDAALALVQGVGGRPGIEVVRRDGPGPHLASVDAGQLQQVMVNLLMNAIQAMDGQGRLVVGVDRVDEAGSSSVRLSVGDTGPGIPPQDLPRIFEPFFTTKAVGEGTGLGLSVSFGIVRDHGGRIDVESEPGKGSVFRVMIPAGKA